MRGIGKLVRRLAIGLTVSVGIVAALMVGWIVAYRWVDPPVTPLMLIREAAGVPTVGYRPLPVAQVSPNLVRAVIAAEDSRFCNHGGVDWEAVAAAWADNREGGRLRGGSTISMQTAKNAFLWPDRSWLRKGLEAAFTVGLEATWPKRRVMEVYLSIAEWGPGIYGAEAAARQHFGKPAMALTAREAALLAAVPPNPRRWSASRPTTAIGRRAELLLRRMAIVRRDGLDRCVLAHGAASPPG